MFFGSYSKKMNCFTIYMKIAQIYATDIKHYVLNIIILKQEYFPCT